ncbi:flagellar protein FlgN [Cellulosilyticum ruminicola]|uniref:flagellar protein FlgN n=1 Tax=Cellulosilyticum ruminicola TaxID=425254 RepID=UPI0006D1BC02|nr:flagellar protein FlgN [Cellulosilyticum ruminicola]
MAGIIYEFVDVLEAQIECYEGLNQLAQYKQQAIIEKNIELLEEVTSTEEQFVGRLGILDKKREVLMKDIGIVTGMNYKEITLTTIAAKLGETNEVSGKLISLRDKIKEELTTLKRQSELNKELLNQSLEFVDFMINAIGSTKGYTHVGNYGKLGEGQMLERQQSVFDHKQ